MFYISANSLATLNPQYDAKFFRFNSRTTVLNNLLCHTEIVAEESIENFFPYPQLAYNKYRNQHPSINSKKIYLVKMKFKESTDPQYESLVENKLLFNNFLRQLFINSTGLLRKHIKFVTADVDRLFREANRLGGSIQGGYQTIREYKPFQFYCLFKALLDNPDMLIGQQTLEHLLQINFKSSNKFSLSNLKSLNKEYSGKLVLPKET